jgi:hypothetical protein
MGKITLYVSRQDFADAKKFQLRSPLLMALQRWTGTLWRLHDGGYLLEAMHPFRACQLSPVLIQTLEEYGQTESLYPFIVELELEVTQEADGYPPMQKRLPVQSTEVQQAHPK